MMTDKGKTVIIVDDDHAVRDALALALGLSGYPVLVFGDAESLLAAYRPEWHGCLLIDIRMPGMDGLELQQRLLDIGCRMPAIIMTGHGDIEAARRAFKARAVDFLEKPIDPARLRSALDEIFAQESQRWAQEEELGRLGGLFPSLTPREREVMELVVAGRHNREVALLLGISPRTVEVHKANLLTKLQLDNIPDLVRLNMLARQAGCL